MLILKRITAIALTTLGALHVAHAQSLDFVGDTTDSVLTVVDGISLAVVTIAILLAGFGFLFGRLSGELALKVLVGGAIVGSAAQIAQFFVS